MEITNATRDDLKDHRWKPGQSGNPKGRPKGTGSGQQLVKAILATLDELGGQKWLKEQAEKHPTQFMQLIGKILPKQATLRMSRDPIEEATRGIELAYERIRLRQQKMARVSEQQGEESDV